MIIYYLHLVLLLSREQTEITIEHSGDSSVVKTKSKTDSSHRTKDEAETMHYDTAASLLVASSKVYYPDATNFKYSRLNYIIEIIC